MAAKASDEVYGRQTSMVWLFEQRCFSRSLKVVSGCKVTTSAGRLFHRRGAAASKAVSPAVLSRVRRTISLWDDSSRQRGSSQTAHCSSLDRYSRSVWLMVTIASRLASYSISSRPRDMSLVYRKQITSASLLHMTRDQGRISQCRPGCCAKMRAPCSSLTS